MNHSGRLLDSIPFIVIFFGTLGCIWRTTRFRGHKSEIVGRTVIGANTLSSLVRLAVLFLAQSVNASYAVGAQTEPHMLAEGIVSTYDNELGGDFAPDGKEL